MSGDQMRVLFISPLRGMDPPNGDVTYTEGLLDSPPPGVTYVTYREAIESGELTWVGARASLRSHTVPRRALVRAAVARKTHRLLSRAHLAFREPVLTAHITGAFDLVHVHAFNVGLIGDHPPLVVSNACPTELLYRDFERWSPWRVYVARRIQSYLARLSGARLVSDHPLPDATWLLFSEYLVRHYAELGVDAARIHVVPNSVRCPEATSIERDRSLLGFCAKDFDGKGGRTVVDAFTRARRSNPSLRLETVGHEPPPDLAHTDGVTWHGEIPREHLLASVMPRWGAMVYPTRFDGVPFSVIEALSSGCPVITVPYGALPELVPHGVAGYVAPDQPDAMATAIDYVLDPANNDRLIAGARAWFDSNYCDTATRPALLQAYCHAVNHPTVVEQ